MAKTGAFVPEALFFLEVMAMRTDLRVTTLTLDPFSENKL
jgi:hypothetical protein